MIKKRIFLITWPSKLESKYSELRGFHIMWSGVTVSVPTSMRTTVTKITVIVP